MRGIMRPLQLVLAFVLLSRAAVAALNPIAGEIHLTGNKAALVYKTTPQGALKINLYFPSKWKSSDRRPAIIFFFGGSCATGNPAQFATTAEYFAGRGLVAASAEYRIESVHHTPAERCIEDGKSAVRWLRMNARHLGIDEGQLIAAGGSSGGTAAAFAAYNTAFEPDDEDRSISHAPNALVLINPAFGCPPGQASPAGPCAVLARWKVFKAGPPAILFFGTEDLLQGKARDFARQLIAVGTRAEFYTAAGQQHGFFNRFPNSPWHALVLRQIDLFLNSLGYLKGSPEVEVPANATAVLHRETLVSGNN